MGGPTVQRIIVASEGLGMDRLGVGEGDGLEWIDNYSPGDPSRVAIERGQ